MDPINENIDFLTLLTSSKLTYVLIVAFQVFLIFRKPISDVALAWSKYIATKLRLRAKAATSSNKRSAKFALSNGKHYLNDCPMIDVANALYVDKPRSKGGSAVSVLNPGSETIKHGNILIDDESEIRSRFTIVYVEQYSQVTNLMVSLVNLPIDIHATTIIYKNEASKTFIFYVSYYGKKLLLIQDNSEEQIIMNG